MSSDDITIGGVNRLLLDPMSDAAEAELRPGQSVEARVLKLLADGDVLLGFGANRAVLSPSSPLQPGDRVVLEVVTGGPKPEFRLVTDNTAAGPPLVAGERLGAQVIELLAHGDALLEFGEHRAIVRTIDAVQPGDRVLLDVVAGGPRPEVRMVTDATTPASPQPAAGHASSAPVLELLSHGDVPLELGPNRTAERTSNPVPGLGQGGAVRSVFDALQPGDRVVLEVVTGGPKPELRVVTDNTAASARSGDGQPAAHVLATLPNGNVLLELGANRAVAETSNLQPGQRVVVEVVTGGVQPELRVVTGDTPARPQPAEPSTVDARGLTPLDARDVPLIVRALADVPPTGVPIAGAKPEMLLPATMPDLQPGAGTIPRLLPPLEAALPTAALAALIGTFFAQSGPVTGRHLPGALNNVTGTPAVDHVHAIPDVLRLSGELAPDSHPASDRGRSFGEGLLQQQIAVAERLAANGGGHLTIPFTFGDKQVDVVFEWERPARRGDQDRPGRGVTLGVFVHLKALGAIEARVDWQPESLAVTFFVEREATCAIVEAGLDEFSKHLTLSGCPAVTSKVWLNPGRLANASPPAQRAMDGGKLLDVMA